MSFRGKKENLSGRGKRRDPGKIGAGADSYLRWKALPTRTSQDGCRTLSIGGGSGGTVYWKKKREKSESNKAYSQCVEKGSILHFTMKVWSERGFKAALRKALFSPN